MLSRGKFLSRNSALNESPKQDTRPAAAAATVINDPEKVDGGSSNILGRFGRAGRPESVRDVKNFNEQIKGEKNKN